MQRGVRHGQTQRDELPCLKRWAHVGCGPGPHAYQLDNRGFSVHGIHLSQTFIDVARKNAPAGATFERMDARQLSFLQEFDAVLCLCQGAFGLMTAHGHDVAVLQGIANAVKPEGAVALSAFNAYFAVKYHDAAEFDADAGVSHELTEVKNASGQGMQVDLWTGCYTPRELRLLLAGVGLDVRSISSVEPGAYGNDAPTLESPEFLVIAFATPLHRMGTR